MSPPREGKLGHSPAALRGSSGRRIISPVMNSRNTAQRQSESSVLPRDPGDGNKAAKLPPLSVSSKSCEDTASLYNQAMELIDVDSARAAELLRCAAERGCADAMYQYARLLAKHDEPAACKVMKSAARRGQGDALVEYGVMLERGIGCQVNREEAYHIYRKGVRNGDTKAMYYCGKLLKDCGQKTEEMFNYLKAASEQNVQGALFELGLCYKNGIGAARNPTEATKIFKLLSDQGDPGGMLEYAIALKTGAGVNADQQAFVQLLNRAIEANSVEAKIVYAQYLENGDGFPKDVDTAERIYREIADQGHAIAQYRLGSLLQQKKEYDDALKYYHMAASQHHATALFSLAMLQLRFPRYKKEGMENLKSAADSGNSRAQYNYALYLEKEHGDKNEVAKYYRMASEVGLPNAMCNYAAMLLSSDGDSALKLFKEAADKGHAISAYRYGKILQRREPQEAAKYFRMGADKNHSKSQYELAMMLMGSSPQESLLLLQKSANNGYAKAQQKYSSIVSQNPEVQLQQWVTTDVDPSNADSVFQAASEILEPLAAKCYFEKLMKRDDSWFKLRYGQVLLRSDVKEGVKMIQELAKGGFVEAKFVYATILEEGKLVKQNMLEAKKFYQEAIKAKHAMAMCRYGKIMKIEDQALAFDLFKRAAEIGLPMAQYQYARMLEISGADTEAVKFYKMASDQGIAKARFRYGRAHEICSKVARNYEVASQYYEIAAKQGYPKAQNNYAHVLELGLGVEPNPELAADYYKRAADQGNTYGRHNYARILESGIGIQQDEAKAAQIYKELAQNEENGLAQYHYARMCHNGIGVPENYDEAKKYYLQAIDNNIAEAKQNYGVLLFTKFHKWNEAARYFEMAVSGNGGQPSAKYNFAQLLMQGMGVPEDIDLAEKFFKEAAETFIPAMVSYAQLLETKTESDDHSFEEAAVWYKKAADAPDPEHKFLKPQRNAQYRLGLMYRDGVGVAQSSELSAKYMKLAAANKHPDAESMMEPQPVWDLGKLIV